MTRHHHRWITLSLAGLTLTQAALAQNYGIRVMPLPEGEYDFLEPVAISANGTIITGRVFWIGTQELQPFRWATDQLLPEVLPLPPDGLGDLTWLYGASADGGSLCGGYYSDQPYPNQNCCQTIALRWNLDNSITQFKNFPGSASNDREAFAINDDGSVLAGYGLTTGGIMRPVIFTPTSTTNAGTVPGYTGPGMFLEVSGDGTTAAGIAIKTNGIDRVITRKVGAATLQSLGLPPNSGTGQGVGPTDLSSNGLDVLINTGFVWTEGIGYQALPPLPTEPGVEGMGISADGRRIFGNHYFAATQTYDVLIWDDLGTPFKLAETLAAHGVTVPPEADMLAYAMSKDGTTFMGLTIDGYGLWVATIPPIDTNTCYADCDASGALSIDDFICFQTFFALGDPFADCDQSGSLSIDDFICFQTFFAIGC